MHPREDLSVEAHRRFVALHGGAEAAFAVLAAACVRRFLAQNGREPLPDAWLALYAARLWSVANEAGMPAPLGENETGEPTEMSADEVAKLAERIFVGLPLRERHEELATPTRQLLKACLQPEFRRCRDSYKEAIDGKCRRQELARASERVSGSHCVDCPHWIALRPDLHRAFLAREWIAGGPAEFAAHCGIFLPEDFRELRIFLWRERRAV